MVDTVNTMMDPPVEGLLERAGSKFSLVTLAAKRARQINSYYGRLGDSSGKVVPPQVTSTARKALSISFEEIEADKVVAVGGASGHELPAEFLDEQPSDDVASDDA